MTAVHRLRGLHGGDPPRWAEAVLVSCLSPRDRQTVSGDLLEEYKARVHAGVARAAVDRWYIRQVLGFAWRAHLVWALLLSAAFASRTGLDWFAPTTDFKLRAIALTVITAVIFVAAGFSAAWRSRFASSGAIAGATTALVAAIIGFALDIVLLALWHDAGTLAAIAASGGLMEAFTLPMLLVFPGAAVGVVGGAFGRLARS